MEIAIWVVAAMIYLAFRLWYDGFGKPLTPDEIDHFLQLVQDRAGQGPDTQDIATQDIATQDIATLRKFMEADDGKEFIMVNLIEFNASPVSHPDTGRDIQAAALLTEYTRPFMGKILRRAGHPVIAGQGVGGYLDAWNTPPDPGWHMAGLVRYRSRRDVIMSCPWPIPPLPRSTSTRSRR